MATISISMLSNPGVRAWDYGGVGTSMLCIAHCITMPLLAGIAPVLAAAERPTHLGLTSVLFLIGLLAFVPARRAHGRMWPALTALLGFAMLVGAVLLSAGPWSEIGETGLTVAGGALLITAHLTNIHYCRSCRTCGEEPCRALGRAK